MAWLGRSEHLGRRQRELVDRAVIDLAQLFPAVVILVRTPASDDRFVTVARQTGDEAICERMVEEYGVGELDDEAETEAADGAESDDEDGD